VTRTVTLVVVSADGVVLGELPPFEVPTPWWQEVGSFGTASGIVPIAKPVASSVAPPGASSVAVPGASSLAAPGASTVVRGAEREAGSQGVDLQVLRMLRADRMSPPGGHVTYLAQISEKSGSSDWVSVAKAAIASSAGRARRAVITEKAVVEGEARSRGGAKGRRRGSGRQSAEDAEHESGAVGGGSAGVAERASGVVGERGGAGGDSEARDDGDHGRPGEGGEGAAPGDWRASLRPVSSFVDLGAHPKRPPYAEVGGPRASVTWARTVLGNLVTAHQERTWNLSALWRLDDMRGRPVAWLKQVPKFFAHEAEAIRLVSKIAPTLVPYVIVAGEEGRILMRHVPGEDGYGAGPQLAERVLRAFHPVQAWFVKCLTDEDRRRTIEAIVPDGRLDAGHFAKVAAPFLGTIPGLRELIDDLPRRIAEINACGLPDTLVHGDLHVGNVRTDDTGGLAIVDWADCFIGNPGFDLLRVADGDPAPLIDRWADDWEETAPGCDPRRAVELLKPVAALRAAATYSAFLENIEPTEWPHHAQDVPAALARAASMVG
jgi:hypothetical protein